MIEIEKRVRIAARIEQKNLELLEKVYSAEMEIHRLNIIIATLTDKNKKKGSD